MKLLSRTLIAAAILTGLAACDDAEPSKDVTATETVADVAAETVADVAAETVADVAAETVADAGPETADDVAAETVEDVAAETIEDVAAETVEDVATETVEDVATETVEDVATETVDDVATETVDDVADDSVTDTPGETMVDSGGETMGPSCDNTGFVPVTQDSYYSSFNGVFLYVAQDTQGAPVTTLNIELVDVNGGASTPGTYALTGDDYESCANCVLVWKDCDENLSNCAKTFLAQSGTLTLDSYGQETDDTFSGTLTDVVLHEVTLNGLSSTLVENGETWCVPSYSFTSSVQ